MSHLPRKWINIHKSLAMSKCTVKRQLEIFWVSAPLCPPLKWEAVGEAMDTSLLFADGFQSLAGGGGGGGGMRGVKARGHDRCFGDTCNEGKSDLKMPLCD